MPNSMSEEGGENGFDFAPRRRGLRNLLKPGFNVDRLNV
jgi:hypothetical protein